MNAQESLSRAFVACLKISQCPAEGTSWHVSPTNTQISLRINTVGSESLMGTLWLAKGPMFILQVEN